MHFDLRLARNDEELTKRQTLQRELERYGLTYYPSHPAAGFYGPCKNPEYYSLKGRAKRKALGTFIANLLNSPEKWIETYRSCWDTLQQITKLSRVIGPEPVRFAVPEVLKHASDEFLVRLYRRFDDPEIQGSFIRFPFDFKNPLKCNLYIYYYQICQEMRVRGIPITPNIPKVGKKGIHRRAKGDETQRHNSKFVVGRG